MRQHQEHEPLAEQFAQLVEEARHDPHIVALWLDGSRGKGVKVTEYSDYDVRMLVIDDIQRWSPSGLINFLLTL